MNQAENALENESWYRVLFSSNPLPMFIYDVATYGFIDVNASAVAHYGYSPHEWMGLTLTDLSPHPNLTGAAAPRAAIADAPDSLSGPSRHLTKDGRLIDVELIRHVVRYHDKTAALLIVHDVSTQWQLDASLRIAKQELDRAQHIARLGSWTRDFTTEKDRWSNQNYRNLGLLPQSRAPSYQAFLDAVHPADRERADAAISLAVAARQPFAFQHRVIWPDGSIHELKQQGVVFLDHSRQPLQVVGTSLDISEQNRVEVALRQAEKESQRAQRVAHLGTWAVDLATDRLEAWSEETFRIFGYPEPDPPSYQGLVEDRIHRDDRDRARKAHAQARADPRVPYDVEFRILNPRSGERTVHCVADVLIDRDGMPFRMAGFVQDVTEARRAEQQTRYFAYFDKPTGLPNRTSLERFLDEAFAPPDGAHGQLGLLIVHLTRFREINFTLSHNEGDQLLKAVGMRIRETLDGEGFVSRVGNSQFAVALTNADGEHAKAIAQKILSGLQMPFLIAGITYGLGAHVGIALAPGHGSDPATILRKAEVALFQAKQAGQACLLYDPRHDPYNPQRLALIGEFRKSLLAGELRLYCQPKADIRTGNIIGAEALVRWEHPLFGLIPPDQFIPLIEPTELIHPLTQFMLEASIKQSLEWRRAGIELPIAVNLSARDLVDPNLVQNLGDTLSALGAQPDCLGLEITESSLLADPQSSSAELHRLSSMGCRLYIDDFGTGYSSLSYLMRLPVNVIKIDHSFTMRMIEEEKAATIVRSTIDLAHNLGMQVVAEGTATREIWDVLNGLGCDEAQGNYISPALPAQDLLPWMRNSGFGIAPIARHGTRYH
jgi:diguanylate cyclase (GGDEF)-like protein/PAS domain S-box-containing protein